MLEFYSVVMAELERRREASIQFFARIDRVRGVLEDRADKLLSEGGERVAGGEATDRRFDLRLLAFDGDPGTVGARYASAAWIAEQVASVMPAPGTWQQASVGLTLPAGTTSVLVEVYAYEDVVNDDGRVETWALEAAGATTLVRGGIAQDEVEPGDTIRVRCHPLRDGANGCLLGFVTTSDGVEKEWD